MKKQLNKFFGGFGISSIKDDNDQTIVDIDEPAKPSEPLIGFGDTVNIGDHIQVRDSDWTRTNGVVITGTLTHFDIEREGASLFVRPDNQQGRTNLLVWSNQRHRYIVKL